LSSESCSSAAIDDAAAKDELGAKTREHKQKNLTFGELQEAWRGRMTQAERNVLATLARKLGGGSRPGDGSAAQRAVTFAIEHEFERKSVVPERVLLARAYKHAAGSATVEQVRRAMAKTDLIYADRGGRRMATTGRVLAEEQRLVDFARKGRGTMRPFQRKVERFNREWLNADQKRAVRHIVESKDRVILLRGKAGVGKTTLLEEAKEQIEEAGTKVLAFAPSAEASRGELRKAGFKDADTLASLLADPRKQQQAAGQVILIDEAGQVGSKTMNQVFDLAKKIDARLLLSGDVSQHGSVERGAALRLLEEEAGIRPAELDAMGWIVEQPGSDRYSRIAADYAEATKNGKSTLVISPTHREATSSRGKELAGGLRETPPPCGRSRTRRAGQAHAPVAGTSRASDADGSARSDEPGRSRRCSHAHHAAARRGALPSDAAWSAPIHLPGGSRRQSPCARP